MEDRGYYRLASVAMLFATGEVLFALAMHGWAQVGMFLLAGASYFIAYVGYKLHYNHAQYNYIANKEKYV